LSVTKKSRESREKRIGNQNFKGHGEQEERIQDPNGYRDFFAKLVKKNLGISVESVLFFCSIT